MPRTPRLTLARLSIATLCLAAACGGGDADGTPGDSGTGGDSTGPAAAARTFLDHERGSILRRHVRRHCTE
jgi:hypothetical protein